MAKFAVIFILSLISCSFLSQVASAEPVKHKCPETPLPASRYRICTMDMRTFCLVYRDGSKHQYNGSSSCVCSNPKIASYSDGWCSEEHKQEWRRRIAEKQKKAEKETQEYWKKLVNTPMPKIKRN